MNETEARELFRVLGSIESKVEALHEDRAARTAQIARMSETFDERIGALKSDMDSRLDRLEGRVRMVERVAIIAGTVGMLVMAFKDKVMVLFT